MLNEFYLNDKDKLFLGTQSLLLMAFKKTQKRNAFFLDSRE